MQNFLNKLGKTASEAVNAVGNKASELVEIGKLKSKISSQKQNINEAKRSIADYCYEEVKAGKMKDAQIKGLCENIDEYKAAIAELEKQIESIKATYQEETGEEYEEPVDEAVEEPAEEE